MFEAFERRIFYGKPVWRLVADHSHIMDPSVSQEPVPGKDNTFKRVPNVLIPGDEYVGTASAGDHYLPDKHWLRISAYARGRRTRFSNWTAPRTREGN